MIGLLKYNYKIYIKNNKFIIPLICFCIFQYIYYSEGKDNFHPGVIFCSNITFCVMIWMGFIYCEFQDSRTEEIMYLRVNNEKVYWLSKILFMFSIGIGVSLLGTVWAIVKCEEGRQLSNILFAFILQLTASFLGVMIGMILQIKVTGSKNRSILFMIFCGLISMIKMPIIKECSYLKFIMWIFPPISDFTYSCMGSSEFSLQNSGMSCVYCVIYILILIFIYYKLMKKILF